MVLLRKNLSLIGLAVIAVGLYLRFAEVNPAGGTQCLFAGLILFGIGIRDWMRTTAAMRAVNDSVALAVQTVAMRLGENLPQGTHVGEILAMASQIVRDATAARKFTPGQSPEETVKRADHIAEWMMNEQTEIWADLKAEIARRTKVHSASTNNVRSTPNSLTSEVLAELLRVDDRDLALVESDSQSLPISREELRMEILALKAHAINLTIYLQFGEHDERLASLERALYANIRDQAGFLKKGSDLVSLVGERGTWYTGALGALKNDSSNLLPPQARTLSFNGQASHDSGVLFAFLCGATRDPLVVVCGAQIFAVTSSTVRRMLT